MFNLHKRKKVEVELISKVKVNLGQVVAHYDAPEVTGKGERTDRGGYEYRLYFEGEGMKLDFKVDRNQYDAVNENQKGLLTYRGKEFVSFF